MDNLECGEVIIGQIYMKINKLKKLIRQLEPEEKEDIINSVKKLISEFYNIPELTNKKVKKEIYA